MPDRQMKVCSLKYRIGDIDELGIRGAPERLAIIDLQFFQMLQVIQLKR